MVSFIFQDEDSKHQHINVRAALIHVLGDLLQSIGVLISSIIIKCNPELKIADPICTILFACIVFLTTLTILRDTLKILMEGTPSKSVYDAVKKDLLKVSGVSSIHDLQIWSITVDKMIVTVHLQVPPQYGEKSQTLAQASTILKKNYKIHQTTIQIDEEDPYFESRCKKCQEVTD